MQRVAAVLAVALAVLHGLRLFDWYERGIWKKLLLWILFVAYGAIVLGFVLFAASIVQPKLVYPALYAFAAGIALMTLGMMVRVTLGHTGRDVSSPPRVAGVIFVSMVAAFVVRVLLIVLFPEHYFVWIGVTQALWLAAFVLLLAVRSPRC